MLPINKVITEDWYGRLLTDLKRLAFEGIVKTKHAIGKRILKDELKFGKPEYGRKRIENLGKDLDTSARDLWRCMQFAKKCNDITQLNGRTWLWITQKYLPVPKLDTSKTPEFPLGKYGIIYADPPWNYADQGCSGTMADHYKGMKIEDICALPIHKITGDNCILFLWATYPMLKEALQVIESWGFVYKTIAFQWLKLNPKSLGWFYGLGRWTRGNTEPCLLATKGKPKRINADVFQLIDTPRMKHSKKPKETRKRILRLMGDLPRIELFAREKTKGWDVWGNEI